MSERKMNQSIHPGDGLCDAIFHPSGETILTCGSEGQVRSVTVKNLEVTPQPLVDADDPVTALAFVQGSNELVVTSGHETTLYSYPSMEKKNLLCRFENDVTTVSASTTGTVLAVGADGPEIKLVNIADPSTVTQISGLTAVQYVRYSPDGSLLAVADAGTGRLHIYDAKDNSSLFNNQAFTRTVVDSTEQMHRFAWDPSSQYLAIPGANEIRVLSRQKAWKQEFALSKEGHTKAVSVLAFSPNGRYLASSGNDQQLLVWDFAKSEVIGIHSTSQECTALCWSPTENLLAFMCDGALNTWSNVIPEHMGSPLGAVSTETPAPMKSEPQVEEADTDKAANANEDTMSDELDTKHNDPDDDDDDDDNSENVEGDEEKSTSTPVKDDIYTADSEDEQQPAVEQDEDDEDLETETVKRRRLRKASAQKKKRNLDVEGMSLDEMSTMDAEFDALAAQPEGEDDAIEGGFDENGAPRQTLLESLAQRYGPKKAKPEAAVNIDASTLANLFQPQEAFQPASTPMKKKKRYLVWNDMGYITSKEEPTHHSVEIHPADKAKYKVVRMRDHYNFTLASIGEHGAIFASVTQAAEKDRARPSTIFYQPLDTWAPGDWTMFLPTGEDAIALAIGDTWVAVATSKQYIRIISYGNIQKFIFSMESPVVSMVGHGNLLAVVYHRSAALPGHQSLGVRVYDMDTHRVLSDGPCPVSPKSKLVWLYFNTDRMLMTADSKGTIRGMAAYFDNQWTVLLEGSPKKLWPVSVIDGKLFAVKLAGKSHPSALSVPLPDTVQLQMPFVNENGKLDVKKEQEFMFATLNTVQRAYANSEPISLKDQAALDKMTITMLQLACKNNKIVRALDLSTRLRLNKSLNIGITLANHHKKPALAERINMIMQAKFPEGQSSSLVAAAETTAHPKPAAPSVEFADEADGESAASPAPSKASKPKLGAKSNLTLTGRKRAQKQAAELVTPSPKKAKAASNPFAKSKAAAAKPVVNVFALQK